MARIQFRKDTAGTLEFYPPEGRPDSNASLDVYKGQAVWGEGTWPATITLPPFSQNLTATASAGDTEVTVGSTSGLVRGHRFMLKNAFAQQEEVTVDGFDATTIKLVDPIQYDQTTSSTIKAHRLTQALTSGNTANRERNLRALWSYTVDSVDYVTEQYFDIVRQPFEIKITERDLEAFGGAQLIGTLPREQLNAYIEGGHRTLEMMLRGDQIEPDLVRNPDDLRDALAHLVLEAVAQAQGSLGPDGRNRAFERHKQLAAVAYAGYMSSRSWYDADDDLVDSRVAAGSGVMFGTVFVSGSRSNLDDVDGREYEGETPPATYAKWG
jgi:hypothetical protein